MALILELTKYANFSDLFKTIELVLSEFMRAYDKVVAKRMGLRYINAITIKEGDPLDWHNLIANDLTSTIAFLKDKSKLSRVMNTIELNKSDRKIIFRFGLFNSEYPNTIARKEFILDYDCYTDDEKEIDQIADLIREFHDEIVKLFEASIRDNLREIMGEVKNGLP